MSALKTAAEKAIERIDRDGIWIGPNTIPPITDPMGKHWNQPDLSRVVIDDECAYMTTRTFEQLSNYSASVPSGVYPGKAWRSNPATHYPKRFPDQWYLHWFSYSKDPAMCSHKVRRIVLEEFLDYQI